MNLTYTHHAELVMRERRIPAEWVGRCVEAPALRECDPGDAELERLFISVPECEGRVLRVVVNTRVDPWRVVSVFFDRSMKGKL